VTTYTHGHQESVLRSHRSRTAESSAGYLLPHLRPDMSLLDVGCGPATITNDLAALVKTVVGIDPSSSVITEAQRDFPALDLRVGDLFEQNGHYDVVHAHQVLQHVADPVQALREMRRVCRPGGLVAVRDSDYGAFIWFPASRPLDRWRELYRAAARRNGGEPDAGRRLLSWAHAAGFADVTATTGTWCFATPEDRAWWGGLWADRVRASDLRAHLLATGDTDEAELQQLEGGWRAWAAEDDGWFSVLHGEVLCRA
jgi:2-polyprenyl-3-methyl-5-hydroxy-6-metoxy-1,4-benzoquinol methylase